MGRRGAISRRRFSLLLPLVGLVVLAIGCQNALFTVAYLLRGTDEPPDCDALQGKRVAVVCRASESLHYTYARVGQDLAEQVALLLRKRVSKIKVIDHHKVDEWMDQNTWDDYIEVGKALGADMVVGIDLEQFQDLEGQTLLQGRATCEVSVYNCKTGKLVFQRRLPQSVYPPNRVVPTSDKTELDFRQEFLRVLADQIGRSFYAHDPYADMALDAKSMD